MAIGGKVSLRYSVVLLIGTLALASGCAPSSLPSLHRLQQEPSTTLQAAPALPSNDFFTPESMLRAFLFSLESERAFAEALRSSHSNQSFSEIGKRGASPQMLLEARTLLEASDLITVHSNRQLQQLFLEAWIPVQEGKSVIYRSALTAHGDLELEDERVKLSLYSTIFFDESTDTTQVIWKETQKFLRRIGAEEISVAAWVHKMRLPLNIRLDPTSKYRFYVASAACKQRSAGLVTDMVYTVVTNQRSGALRRIDGTCVIKTLSPSEIHSMYSVWLSHVGQFF